MFWFLPYSVTKIAHGNDFEGLYFVFSNMRKVLLLPDLRCNSAAIAEQYSFVQIVLLTAVQVLGFIAPVSKYL